MYKCRPDAHLRALPVLRLFFFFWRTYDLIQPWYGHIYACTTFGLSFYSLGLLPLRSTADRPGGLVVALEYC